MMQDTPGEERSLGELFGDLTRELTTLIRQEATLARTELSQKAAGVGKDVGFRQQRRLRTQSQVQQVDDNPLGSWFWTPGHHRRKRTRAGFPDRWFRP